MVGLAYNLFWSQLMFPRTTALLLFAGLLFAEDTHNPRTSPADVAAGAKTFHSHCSPCHGYQGEGGRGPNLAAGRFYHGSSDADLLKNISEGIPGTEMPGLFYNADRVWQVIAFIRSLNANNAKPPGDAEAGAALFRSQGCAGCHRIRGEGGALGPDLSGIGAARSVDNLKQSILDPSAQVQPSYWTVSFEDASGKAVQGFLLNEDTYTVQLIDRTATLHSYEKAAVKNYTIDKHSAMPSYRDKLSSQQLDDLVVYLWSQRPQ
jgi:cytochrome c oxidase cbb3-type subunit 3